MEVSRTDVLQWGAFLLYVLWKYYQTTDIKDRINHIDFKIDFHAEKLKNKNYSLPIVKPEFKKEREKGKELTEF